MKSSHIHSPSNHNSVLLLLNPTYSLLCPAYYPFNTTSWCDLEKHLAFSQSYFHPPRATFLLVEKHWVSLVSCTELQSHKLHRSQSRWSKQPPTAWVFITGRNQYPLVQLEGGDPEASLDAHVLDLVVAVPVGEVHFMPIWQFHLEFVCQHFNDNLGEEGGGREAIWDNEEIKR